MTVRIALLVFDGCDLPDVGGFGLQAQTTVADLGDVDVVVVPGLIDLDAALGDAALVADVSDLVDLSEVDDRDDKVI